MKKSLLPIGLLAIFIGLFTACELDNLTDTSNLKDSEDVVTNNANAQMQVVKVFENVNNFAFATESMKSLNGGDPVATFEGNTMTLDFTNVDNANGKVIVAFNGSIAYATNLSAAVTFENYENEGTAMDGLLTLTITEFVPNTRVEFTLYSDGLTMTEGDITYMWSCNQVLLWETGFETLNNADDDEYLLNGTSSQDIDGIINNSEQSDILNATSCDYILSGILTLTQDATSDVPFVVSCDFSVGETEDDNGQCDGWVELSTNGLPPIKFEL